MGFLLEVLERGLAKEYYDFSKFNYISSRQKVTIICKKHGEFQIRPDSFLKGQGCNLCANERRSALNTSSTEEYLAKVAERKLSNPNYDFSKLLYINNRQKVTIICKKHGEFQIRPDSFLKGQGCNLCANERRSALNTSSTEEYLAKVAERKLSNPNYDFSKLLYINNRQKVTIICKKHGEFQIRPDSFLKGQGCNLCANERRSALNTSSTEEYLAKVAERKLNNPNYDFSKFNYIRSRQKATIICKEHGEFLISPNSFLAGQNCAKCAKAVPHDRSKKTFVYILTDEENQKSKIGVSCDLAARILNLNRKTPFNFSLFETFEFNNFNEAFVFEQNIHKILKENLCQFEETFQGYTEWFNITGENAVTLINSILPDFYIETLD